MVSKNLSFVTTTISDPVFLQKYIRNIKRHDHNLSNISFIVVGDLKTPLSVQDYCEDLSTQHGVEVQYLGVEDQIDWLDNRNLTELKNYLPYNSIQRRNIGYLRACEKNADVIVSLDDDNLAGENDIVDDFASVGEPQEVLEVTTSNDWYNAASMMEYENEKSQEVYHRGFPYSRRTEDQQCSFKQTERNLMIRAGLWVDVPDVDVITHLERNPQAVKLRDKFNDNPVALGDGIFSPVNTQNTAFHTDIMPLIHTIPMGDTVEGMEISRFDDIWLGYFAEKVLHNTNCTVGYGTPISTHDRNTHDLKRELEHEAIGIKLNECIVDALSNIDNVSGSNYYDCYRRLIQKLRGELTEETKYSFQSYFEKMLDGMEIWTDACEEICT